MGGAQEHADELLERAPALRAAAGAPPKAVGIPLEPVTAAYNAWLGVRDASPSTGFVGAAPLCSALRDAACAAAQAVPLERVCSAHEPMLVSMAPGVCVPVNAPRDAPRKPYPLRRHLWWGMRAAAPQGAPMGPGAGGGGTPAC